MEINMNTSGNKEKLNTAVALSYEPDEQAPKIIAAGRGHIAERIKELANDNNIPLYKDEHLANTLSKLEIGSYIPPEIYDVVAEILVFVDKMDRIKGKVDYE